MATAYASGLRGDDPTYLKTAPTLKHFLGYNNEIRRDTTSTDLPPAGAARVRRRAVPDADRRRTRRPA